MRPPFWGPLELARLSLVRADIVARVTRTRDRFTAETGHRIVLQRGWVPIEEQERVYADSVKAGYRAAPADKSRHPLGSAVDVGIVGRVRDAVTDQRDPLYRRLAEIAEQEGLRAGYFFTSRADLPDPYHLEGRETLAESRALWKTITRERLQRLALTGALVIGLAGLAWLARRILLNRG
jgi:hypothetical protein